MHKALSILLLAVLVSCDQSPPEPPMAAEPWSTQPPDQWPQMVLTHDASFKGSSPLQGASGFLIRTSSGVTLGATALHLLGENGGVDPEVTLDRIDSSIDSWVMHPRTMPDKTVRILGSASKTKAPRNNDWLLLRVEDTPGIATPLKLRRTPVKVGERVHLIGVSYNEPDVAQKVYSGKVTARGYGDRFRYDVSPHVKIPGFSGAPIVDDSGHVVGVMTVWFDPKMDGELWTEAGGEDAASAFAIQRDPK